MDREFKEFKYAVILANDAVQMYRALRAEKVGLFMRDDE